MSDHRIECSRAEDFLASLPDASVSLIVTDPPYHRVKSESWDNQWKSDKAFLDWMRGLCREWRRVLRPNGSIYVFASPQMAWGVEGVVREFFEVLCNIRWAKENGRHKKADKESLRSPFPASETAVMAEQRGVDSLAMAESGYGLACDKLRGGIFEPIRAYLDGERIRAGFSRADCDKATGNQMSGHYFSTVQWTLPTRENYEKLRAAFNARSAQQAAEFLRVDYEALRVDYEALRVDYEALRRPFTVSSSVPYTDVWTYPTVPHYTGKHPCEKPAKMALDIVRASSRPGDVVLDSFAGSGTFASAAVALGRVPWTCDMDPHWADVTRERVRLSGEIGTVVDLRGVRKPGRVAPPAQRTLPVQPSLFTEWP